jgi:hypothetical protein
MKYNFVFDKEFEESLKLELSNEEWGVVLATVIGKHNAIFFGYKPERLIKAIKKLCESYVLVEERNLDILSFTNSYMKKAGKGTVLVPNINNKTTLFYDSLKRASSDEDRECNIVAYDTGSLSEENEWFAMAIKYFDIVYKCEKDTVANVSLSNVKERLENARKCRAHWKSGQYVTGKFTRIEPYWVKLDCFEKYEELAKEDSNLALKYMKVARSISDIRGIIMTRIDDLDTAIGLYYKGE